MKITKKTNSMDVAPTITPEKIHVYHLCLWEHVHVVLFSNGTEQHRDGDTPREVWMSECVQRPIFFSRFDRERCS